MRSSGVLFRKKKVVRLSSGRAGLTKSPLLTDLLNGSDICQVVHREGGTFASTIA